MAAFNFADELEASNYREVVLEKKRRKARNSSSSSRSHASSNNNMQSYGSQLTLGTASVWSGGNQFTNGSSQLSISNGNLSVPQHQRSNSTGTQLKTPDKQALSKKRTRNLTTRDISAPSGFQHVQHVGWDADKGFETFGTDEHMKQFFEQAGVSEKELGDQDTREFIYCFLEEKLFPIDSQSDNKVEVINHLDAPGPSNRQPPPVPARSIPQARPAPPPPAPSRTPRPPPPPPTNSRTVPTVPTKPNIIQNSIQAPPNVPPPPPPPPPPSSGVPMPPPPPPPQPTLNIPETNSPLTNTCLSPNTDARSALLESIRMGKKLKHIEVETKSSSSTSVNSDTRSDLMNEIRQGIELKSVTINAKRPVAALDNRLASALARALAERSRALHSDSSDTCSDDDDWE